MTKPAVTSALNLGGTTMSEILKQRREKLMENKQGPCMVCIYSGSAPMKSLDEAYAFAVDRNFYYLTGIDRENMILVLKKVIICSVSNTPYFAPAKWE